MHCSSDSPILDCKAASAYSIPASNPSRRPILSSNPRTMVRPALVNYGGGSSNGGDDDDDDDDDTSKFFLFPL